MTGLYFASNEVVQDQRTSLNLTPDNPLKLANKFRMEFDLMLRKGDGYYGYIFRIIGNGENNIDLISNFASTSENFSLVFQDKILCSYRWQDLSGLDYNKWTHVIFELDLQVQEVSLSIDGVEKSSVINYPAKTGKFDFLFGISKNSPFQSTDVCPMTLRDILIYDQNDRMIRNWELSKHHRTMVYDEIAHAGAIVENPSWIIDSHLKWEKLEDLKIDHLLGIATDEENGRLFFVNKEAVYGLMLSNFLLDTIFVKNGKPFDIREQVVYNKYVDEIWSYNFKSNEISRFNFVSKSWSIQNPLNDDPGFAHHNVFINPLDSSLNGILGYGYYWYKAIVNHFDTKNNQWIQLIRNDQIEPRYLSGAGLLNKETMLIFGGYGSKTGRQELSPGFFYDLFELNLKDYSFQKRWVLAVPPIPFVPCNQLIINEDKTAFYTLVYNNQNFNTSMRLARFTIEDAEYQLYDDLVSYDFLDVDSWSSMIYDDDKSELVAITVHNDDVSVYKIAYPPLRPEDVYQEGPSKNSFELILWMGIVSFFILTGRLIFVFVRQKKIKIRCLTQNSLGQQEIWATTEIQRTMVSSVHFLGGFQIYNRFGLDITPDFSPTLKQLFLIIFLNTIRNGKGISSAKLDDTLWYDKHGKSARNNRNVNVSKLRSAVEDVGGIEVVNENSFWKMKISESIYCDYTEVLGIIKKANIIGLNRDETERLIGLLSFGDFLPNVQTSWADPFKSTFANDVIDCLIKLIHTYEVKADYEVRYHLADCISIFDPVNEEALAVKCQVLYQMGKQSMAKNTYASFCRDYKQLLGVEYPLSFNVIVT